MKLSKITQVFETFFTPLFFLFSGILILLEYLNGTNFVLNTFRLDYVDMFALSLIFISIVLFKNRSIKNFMKCWKKLVFVFPVLLILAAMIVFMRYNQLYVFLEAEDSIVEWMQFFFISLISIFNFLLFLRNKSKNKLIASIFLVAAFGFFMIAGEEISWGQRIFNLKTPESYALVNTQQELTLHNYGPAFGYVYVAYMYFGLLASSMWLFKPALKKISPKALKLVFTIFIPGWQYFIYFFVAFSYNFERIYFSPMKPGDRLWEEPMELLLFIGIALFFLELLVNEIYSDKRN